MRILGMMIVMIFSVSGLGLATTVDLTDGRVVQGDIIKRDNKSLQIAVDGVNMTYYADEIKDVDGASFASGQAVSAAVTTAPTPAPVAAPAPEAAPAVQPAVAPTPAAQAEPAAQPEAAPASTPGTDGIDPDKKDLILKFIDVFGTRQALANNFDMMVKQIEKEKPDEAQKIRERVKIDEIIERLLPVYDRNFSSEDLKAFISFYGSPEGQKLITTIPVLMKESVQESVKYMEEKFPEN